MTVQSNPDVRDILKRYFSNILYIDDMLRLPETSLDGSMSREETSVSAEASAELSERPIDEFGADNPIDPTGLKQSETPQNASSFLEAYNVLYQFQQESCSASPYCYGSDDDISDVVTRIERTHLTLLDWRLDNESGDKTLEILKKTLVHSTRMNLLVIYTEHPDEPIETLANEFHVSPQEFRTQSGKSYTQYVLKNAFILVCSKQLFSAGDILNIFIDSILNQYGSFPVSFFDAINQVNENTAELLQEFVFPFDNTMLLQLQSSGLRASQFSGIVSRLVTNHISKVISISDEIFNNMIDEVQQQYKTLAKLNHKDRQELLLRSIKLVQGSKTSTNYKIINDIHDLDFGSSFWDAIFTDLSSDYLGNINEVVKRICEEFKRLSLGKIMTNLDKQLRTPASLPQPLKGDLERHIKDSLLHRMENWIKPIVPVVLMQAIQQEPLSRAYPGLIKLLKLISYREPSLNEVKDMPAEQLTGFFSTGDILIKDTEGGTPQFLFCVTPDCDAFRPSKTDSILKFVSGQEVKPASVKKDSSQMDTLFPYRGNVICIRWSFYRVLSIDIDEDRSELLKYSRPYRLESEYSQQIVNMYLSYHARAGVNDLFLKKSTLLASLTVQ